MIISLIKKQPVLDGTPKHNKDNNDKERDQNNTFGDEWDGFDTMDDDTE